jgi:hypothetical protein
MPTGSRYGLSAHSSLLVDEVPVMARRVHRFFLVRVLSGVELLQAWVLPSMTASRQT